MPADVALLNGSEVGSAKAGVVDRKPTSRKASESNRSDSSGSESRCSTASNTSWLEGSSNGGGMLRTYLDKSKKIPKKIRANVGECTIEVERKTSAKRQMAGLCTDFTDLCEQRPGILHSLEMYGWKVPNTLQQHLIPMILHVIGKPPDGQPDHGNGCITIQGAAGTGKTSAAILAILSTVDVTLHQPQVIIVSNAQEYAGDRYLRVLALMQAVRCYGFPNDVVVDDNSPDASAIRSAHILFGRARELLAAISSMRSISLENVRIFMVDDAQMLINPSSVTEIAHRNATVRSSNSMPETPASVMRLSGLPSGDKTKAITSEQGRGSAVWSSKRSLKNPTSSPQESRSQSPEVATDKVAEARASGSSSGSNTTMEKVRMPATPMGDRSSSPPAALDRTATTTISNPIEETVRICHIAEEQHYTEAKSDVRHIIIAQHLADSASMKMLKVLKESLTTKKNLLSLERCQMPTKLIKGMKHYYVSAPSSSNVRILVGLVQTLSFPRALIYCDTDGIVKYANEMNQMGITVSTNLPGASSESREKALQDFTSNKTQFFLTHSEPAVCQVLLPKVSCVFHFGVASSTPALYGVRLSPLNDKLSKESTSIVIVDSKKKDKDANDGRDFASGAAPSVVTKLEKTFGISFLNMPLEMLPSTQAAPRVRR
jgi:superfamily II DNA/RNA helicase